MKNIFQKFQKSIWLTILVVLFLISFLVYNKNRVLARDITEEVAPIICEEGEGENPQCYSSPPVHLPTIDEFCGYFKKIPCNACSPACHPAQACCCDAGENILEIPIGRAVDQAEYLAEQIITEMAVLIDNAGQLSGKAQEMPGLAEQCSIDNCEPNCEKKTKTIARWCDDACNDSGPGWYETPCSGCYPSCGPGFICCCTKEEYYDSGPCKGDACPFSAIGGKQSEIDSLGQVIRENQQKIAGFVGEMEEAFEKLQKSRNRLADCVVRPFEETALERGEVTGKFLMSCYNILNAGIPVHSYLGEDLDQLEEGCYGNLYCQVRDEQNKPLPYPPPPCADDYYCCY